MEQKYKPYIMYKITCNDDENLIYIGSTKNFRCRKNSHKSNSININSDKYNLKVYETIRNNGGWVNFTMKPIEMYYADSKIKARIRETELMDVFNSNLNACKSYIGDEEKKENFKIYYKNNKDHINEYRNEYYITNKETINEKHICECGSVIIKRTLNKHLQTKKHQKFTLNSI